MNEPRMRVGNSCWPTEVEWINAEVRPLMVAVQFYQRNFIVRLMEPLVTSTSPVHLALQIFHLVCTARDIALCGSTIEYRAIRLLVAGMADSR